ncbi:uncharacterized protein [Physcomitrium patens]|uniref:uncharacterized protein isoform X3 n=1 Tax=Physcomitrium patens TaxID=3218 RepID=UPI003CCE21DF
MRVCVRRNRWQTYCQHSSFDVSATYLVTKSWSCQCKSYAGAPAVQTGSMLIHLRLRTW